MLRDFYNIREAKGSPGCALGVAGWLALEFKLIRRGERPSKVKDGEE